MNTDRIKFRVCDNINKRYEKDLPLLDKDGDLCYQDGHKYCNGEHPEDFTIEQCTGLRDKNGTLIFEGDIIRTTDYSGDSEVGRVEWKESQYVFVRKVGYFSFQVLLDWGVVLEVIGNVHDEEFQK